MEGFKDFRCCIAVLALLSMISVIPVYGQIQTPCTASMILSLTPCLNFITGSTGNGSSPTSDCCSILKSIMGTSMNCACLLITANVPFSVPINQTLALSLPRACNLPGVPIQCKTSGSPLPAPGPVQLRPPFSPGSSPFSPKASAAPESSSPAPAPNTDTTSTLSPASPPVNSQDPTAVPGIRPVLTPSAANPSHIGSQSVLLFALGMMLLKYY